MNINGEATVSTFTDGLATNSLTDLTNTVEIKLTDNTINLVAPSVLVNGAPIGGGGGGVSNPLSSDLSIGAFNITGLSGGQTLNSITSKVLDTEAKTVNIVSAAFPTTTTMQGILRTDQVATDKVSNQLESDYIDLSTGGISITTSSLTLNGNTILSTPFSSEIEAGSFKKTGGTNIQYLMGDGSVLTQSANSGNSNFYLYNSTTTLTATPANGYISYNSSGLPNASQIFISHLTRDGIDIEVFFKQLSTLTDIYIQDQNVSENYIQYNITGPPVITVGSKVTIPVAIRSSSGTGSTNFPNGHNVLLSFFSNSLEIDTRISAVETKTQNQTAISGTTTFSGTVNATSLVKSGGLATEFLKANGTVDNSSYIVSSSITNSSVPYINPTGGISGANKNLFVMLGVNTIQSAITVVPTGGSIQVSSGGSTENVVCTGQNYTISGTSCPEFAQTTQITGNLTIGSASILSTRVRIKDIKFVGDLTFISSTFNELRTFISNCDFSGIITFPTTSGGSSISINFTDCSFSGASTITIPNQSNYTIYFTRCTFVGQTITNNLTVGNFSKLIFSGCGGLATLSLGFCILLSLNTSITTTQGNYGSVVLGGTATSLLKGSGAVLSGTSAQFVKGDASLDSTVYVPTITGLVGYSGRKFTSSVVALGNVQTNATMIASVLGSITIGANEAQLGDVYRIFMAGNFNNKTVAPAITTITITMFGKPQVITLPALMTTGLKNWSLAYDLIVVAVGTAVNLYCSSIFTSGDPIHSPVVNLTSLTPVNTTIANTLTITYTCPSPVTNEMSVYMVYMHKI